MSAKHEINFYESDKVLFGLIKKVVESISPFGEMLAGHKSRMAYYSNFEYCLCEYKLLTYG